MSEINVYVRRVIHCIWRGLLCSCSFTCACCGTEGVTSDAGVDGSRGTDAVEHEAMCFDGCLEMDSSTAADAIRSGPQTCVSNCEARLWPRLIISVESSDGGTTTSDGGATPLAIRGRSSSGVETDAIRGGCPGGFSDVACDYSFFAGENDSAIALTIAYGSKTFNATVPLKAFNYCGREIALVHFQIHDTDVTISQPDYTSPCERL